MDWNGARTHVCTHFSVFQLKEFPRGKVYFPPTHPLSSSIQADTGVCIEVELYGVFIINWGTMLAIQDNSHYQRVNILLSLRMS